MIWQGIIKYDESNQPASRLPHSSVHVFHFLPNKLTTILSTAFTFPHKSCCIYPTTSSEPRTMMFSTLLLLLSSVTAVMAAPGHVQRGICQPGTYKCSDENGDGTGDWIMVSTLR